MENRTILFIIFITFLVHIIIMIIIMYYIIIPQSEHKEVQPKHDSPNGNCVVHDTV